MRKSLLIVASLGLGVGTMQAALAADLPLKARPMAPPVAASWTGCYIGGHVGYAWSRWTDNSLPNAVDPGGAITIPGDTGEPLVFNYDSQYNPGGVVGGGQFGCDKQFGTWVIGAVIDVSWTDQSESHGGFQIQPTGLSTTSSPFETATVDLKYFGTARARLGFLVQPSFLLYGTGGLAWARGSLTIAGQASSAGNLLPAFSYSNETNFVGWAAGVGGEWMYSPNWTFGIEYLHLDLGDANFKFAGPFPNGTTTVVIGGGVNMSLTSDLVRGTVNYRF